MKATSKICAVGLFLIFGAPAAYASHPVEIYFDGAWCQRTAGQGHDVVVVAANSTVYPASGFFDPNDPNTSHAATFKLGDYNDRGGNAHQEMRKQSLLGFVLAPGQSADVVVAMYGASQGGFWDHLKNASLSVGPTIAAAVVTAYGSPVAGTAVKVAGDKTVQGVSKAFQDADPNTYVGDVKIHVENDANDHVTYSMSPGTHASDRHYVNQPLKSQSFTLQGARAEYWPKLAVLVH